MALTLYDLSKLSISPEDKGIFDSNQSDGIIIKSSYFKDDLSLRQRIKQIKQDDKLICLDIDCVRDPILGVDPHLPIFNACNMYKVKASEAIDIAHERAVKVAQRLISEGIDIYTSNIFSFSEQIFNSSKANDNFKNHHIAVMSSWLNGLNSAGMLACCKLAGPISKTSFHRLRIQISALICSDDICTESLAFNGPKLTIRSPENIIKNTDNRVLKNILGSKITQETQGSVEV